MRAKYRFFNEDEVIAAARKMVCERIKTYGDALSAPAIVSDYLRLSLAHLEYEVFGILFLNTQNNLIEDVEMFRGTISQTSVYPREVVKTALLLNAAGVILYHNHPSGVEAPSRADESLTSVIKSSLALVDVRVLDHIIIAGNNKFSFAENGKI